MHFTDHELSRRIELADAANSRRCGNTLAEYHPEMGACTMDVADGCAAGCAIYAGVGSPLTQAIGLGIDRKSVV